MKIDKNIKMTKMPSAKRGQSKYPFATMKIDDSFLLADEKRYSVSTLASRYAKLQDPEWEFTVGKDPKGKGLRCWRVK